MSDFLILYRAEIRKILMKKSFWAALAIGIAFVLVVGLTNLSAEGHLAYVKEQSEVLGELSGKPIDEAFLALTNMAASHFTKSAIVSMAIHAAVLFVGLFNVPKGMRLISKLWELRPTMSLYYGTFCNTYLYGRMNNVQMSILIDGCLIALIFAALALSYRHSQVESR